MLSNWRQELQQSTAVVESRGSRCEGNADEENNTCGDGDGESENEEEEAEDSDSESELLLRETLKKQQYRKRKRSQSGAGDGGDGGGEVDTVTGEIPVDILKRISPLCEKMGLTMRQQLFLTMGFCKLCGK